MKSLTLALTLTLAPLVVAAAGSPSATAPPGADELYFGQAPPGDTPVVFAPGILSKEDRFEQFLIYSPDRREVVYSVTNGDWSSFALESLRFENGAWSEPFTPPFLGGDPDALVAAISADGNRVFFTSARPVYPPCNLWMSERHGDGWSEPVMVGPPISSDGNEFEVAIAADGTLYFSSARNGGQGGLDLYRARPVDGRYPQVENLGPPINTAAGDDLPWIAPDQSFLLFASNREGGYGERDLYVSFQLDGRWTEPLNLGPKINTPGFDSYPALSPEGEYLFFTRRTAWMAEEDSDIYWVRAGILDRLRQQAVAAAGEPGT